MKPSIGWLVALSVVVRPAMTTDWPTLRRNVRCLCIVHELCPFLLLLLLRAFVGTWARAVIKYCVMAVHSINSSDREK